MRILEILYLLSIFLFAGIYYFGKNNRIKIGSAFLSLVLFLLHYFEDGLRWQLTPAYTLSVILALILIANRIVQHWKIGTQPRQSILILSLAFGALAATLGGLFPVVASVPTTGPYVVGQQQFHWIDESRQEIYGEPPFGPRELMITIWYPAVENPGVSPASWMDGIELFSDVMARWLDLPEFTLSHLKLIESSSYPNLELPATSEQFPLLVFSHGWSGFREQNAFQTEELASYGHIVVGINHNFGAMATIFPDERIVLQDGRALPDDVNAEEYKIAAEILGVQWAADISFVFDQLERMASAELASSFAGRIDLSSMAVMGHSTGAGADIIFCSNDIRCRGMLLMDPWMAPTPSGASASHSDFKVLAMFSENWDTLSNPAENYARYEDLMDAYAPDHLMLTIIGTKHADFTVLPLLSPLTTTIGLKGPIENTLGLRIINSISVSFFDGLFSDGNPARASGDFEFFPEIIWDTHP